MGTLRFGIARRKQLVRAGRKTGNPTVLFRCLILATFAMGLSRRATAAMSGCAPSTVCDIVKRFAEAGFDGLADRRCEAAGANVTDEFLDELRRVRPTRSSV